MQLPSSWKEPKDFIRSKSKMQRRDALSWLIPWHSCKRNTLIQSDCVLRLSERYHR